MTDLTEQCKKGELPNDIYYVELLGGNTTTAYMYKLRSYKKIVYRVKSFKGYVTKNQMKAVLSKAPSYDEWQEYKNANDSMFDTIKMLNKDNGKLEKENTKLKELLKECDHMNTNLQNALWQWNEESDLYEECDALEAKINQALGEDK